MCQILHQRQVERYSRISSSVSGGRYRSMSDTRSCRTTLGQSQRRVGEAQKKRGVVERRRQMYERKQRGVWESRLGRCCPSRRDGEPQQLERAQSERHRECAIGVCRTPRRSQIRLISHGVHADAAAPWVRNCCPGMLTMVVLISHLALRMP